MAAQLFEGLLSREPALATALATLIGGFLAQIGPGHVASLKALGTSVTVSGLQGLLTRANVISPASFRRGTSSLSPGALMADGAEPALAMSVIGTLAGFLVQVGGGQGNLLHALGIAGGLAVTQGLVTRQQVFSPRTVALTRLASGSGIEALLGGVPAALPTATPAPAVTRVPPPSTVPTPLMSTEAGAQALLARYRPVVRYDSMESYYADSAGVITDRPGNRLMRSDGTTLVPGPVGRALTLDLLRPGQYDADTPVQNTDYVKEVGSDYVAQARQMHRLPGYGDRVHGRAVRDASGSWWLQYWFCFSTGSSCTTTIRASSASGATKGISR